MALTMVHCGTKQVAACAAAPLFEGPEGLVCLRRGHVPAAERCCCGAAGTGDSEVGAVAPPGAACHPTRLSATCLSTGLFSPVGSVAKQNSRAPAPKDQEQAWCVPPRAKPGVQGLRGAAGTDAGQGAQAGSQGAPEWRLGLALPGLTVPVSDALPLWLATATALAVHEVRKMCLSVSLDAPLSLSACLLQTFRQSKSCYSAHGVSAEAPAGHACPDVPISVSVRGSSAPRGMLHTHGHLTTSCMHAEQPAPCVQILMRIVDRPTAWPAEFHATMAGRECPTAMGQYTERPQAQTGWCRDAGGPRGGGRRGGRARAPRGGLPAAAFARRVGGAGGGRARRAAARAPAAGAPHIPMSRACLQRCPAPALQHSRVLGTWPPRRPRRASRTGLTAARARGGGRSCARACGTIACCARAAGPPRRRCRPRSRPSTRPAAAQLSGARSSQGRPAWFAHGCVALSSLVRGHRGWLPGWCKRVP